VVRSGLFFPVQFENLGILSMKTKLTCILLIDDDPNDILFHRRAIEKANVLCEVIAKESVILALEFIQSRTCNVNTLPELIFVDINLPHMNGWDFLEAYQQLIRETGIQTKSVVVMLSASSNREDEERAKSMAIVSDLVMKPLGKETIEEIVTKYFV
jgi:CheY-like chemotaxis protein